MGVCGMRTLGASPGQMGMTLAGAAAGEEVIIQTFGAMGLGILTLLAFLTCREYLFWILFLTLAYRDDKHVGGMAGGNSGVFNIKIVCWPFYMFGPGSLKSQLC